MSTPNLIAVRQHATQLAKEAGALIMERFGQVHEIKHKSSVFDVATEADQAAEDHIVAALTSAYPLHRIVGEEGGDYGNTDGDYSWYIDPVDGTSNFAGNIPHFCVSIALADADNQPLVGVVYDPNAGELFSAVKGAGATLNDQPMRVSEVGKLEESVCAMGFPYVKSAENSDHFRQFEYFVPRTRGTRRFGSAALELCWVAAGRFEAYWEWSISRWDFFAGALIVEEAGGEMSDFHGNKSAAYYDGKQVMATNVHLRDEVLKGMQHVLAPERA